MYHRYYSDDFIPNLQKNSDHSACVSIRSFYYGTEFITERLHIATLLVPEHAAVNETETVMSP